MANVRYKGALQQPWFLSDRGRNFSFWMACLGTGSAGLAHCLPHTILVSHYRDMVRLYKKGFSVPVPDVLLKRVKDTLDLLQMNAKEKSRFRPFMAAGFDMFSAGTYGRFGVHIGLPVHFMYNSEEDVRQANILVNQEKVVWETEAGTRLMKSLIIPEKAQIYAIASEIKMRDTWKIFFDTANAVLACSICYALSAALNSKLNLFNKPRSVRVVGYTIVGAFCLGNYIMGVDISQNMYEQKIDKELVALNPIFIEGGKEFYSQILERNKALRELMGKEGPSNYTALGNENYLLRIKHAPIVQRKEFFEKYLKPKETNQVL